MDVNIVPGDPVRAEQGRLEGKITDSLGVLFLTLCCWNPRRNRQSDSNYDNKWLIHSLYLVTRQTKSFNIILMCN